MERREQAIHPQDEPLVSQKETETSKAHGIVGYIEKHVLKNNRAMDVAEEKGIREFFLTISPAEKAIMLYRYLVSYGLDYQAKRKETIEKQEKHEGGKQLKEPLKDIANPYLIGEIKVLWEDKETRQIFLEKYGDALIEAKTFRLSDLGRQLQEKDAAIARLEEGHRMLKQSLTLKQVTRPTEIVLTQSRLERTTKDLLRALSDREKIVTLEGQKRTPENTDIAATIMFDILMRYHKEAKAGFAWLPSRRELHQKILDVIEGSRKAPVLIGPPGTGKTSQLDAVARELTGEPTIRIPCNSTLGDEGLVAKRDFRAGEGAYDYEGCIAEAYTGYRHSNDEEPSSPHGRGVNLDEISQLNLEKALGPLKDIRQAREGKPLNRYVRRNVLPGAFLSATSNLPIVDERLDREFGRVPTNYFEMREGNPELYEFMVGKLLQDDKSFPLIAKSELKPAYIDTPVLNGETLSDGSVIIRKEELITDPTNTEHGILYRLAYAIRTLQDSYIHGSKFNEKHLANTALYYDEDTKGNIVITDYVADLKADNTTRSTSGEMLRLTSGSSTLTPEIISQWMEGFKSRMSSKNPKDHVQRLSEWIQLQLENHIDQTSPDDGEKIRAILNHFHLFDENKIVEKPKPLTPKEVGYLSPRVPRPLYVEKPKQSKTSAEQPKKPMSLEEYKTTQVLLETGERVLIKTGVATFKTLLSDQFTITPGKRFRIDDKSFVFVGVVDDKSDKNGKIAASFVDEKDLHRLFTAEDVEEGVLKQDIWEVGEDVELFCNEEKKAKNKPEPTLEPK